MTTKPSQIFLFTDPDQYLFSEDNTFDVPKVRHLPVEVDTEFQQTPCKPSGHTRFSQTTITTQWRHILAAEGMIFAHMDIHKHARHPVAQRDCPLLTYLRHLGVRAEIIPNMDREETDEIIHIHLYSFFAIAELYRIFDGSLLKEIDDLTRSKKGYHIKQGRRVLTESVNGKYHNYVELREHGIRVDGFAYRIRLTIWDTCAVQGTTNYANFAKNSGVKLDFKETFTRQEKASMLENYINRPDDYDHYALGDLHNYDALKGNMEQFKIIYESLGIADLFQLPRLTIGATVARMLVSCLQKYLGNADIKLIDKLTSGGTAKTFLDNTSTTGVFNSKVDGGRCRNNRPEDVMTRNPVADTDISSCYGEGLRNQIYPLGTPFVIDYPVKSAINAYMTLGEFLKKYGDELVPGLWTARVSTPEGYELKHRQDFLISWFPPKDLNKMRVEGEDQLTPWWEQDDVGETRIFTNQVNLAVINHDFIDWLNNVCGKQQRAELLDKLMVICAMFYPDSERVETFEELELVLAQHNGKNTVERKNKRKLSVIAECHAWLGIPMGELIVDVLLKERKNHPKKTPLNELYKLIINTIYGDMVSPFFSVGNVCVGNNITGRARAMAWYMEKGLNGFQTVTDGCAFELNRVCHQTNRETTAESFTPMCHKGMSYKYKPLGGSEWSVVDWGLDIAVVQRGREVFNIDEYLKEIDKLVGEHLRNLFPKVDVLHKVTKDVYGRERVGMFSFETKGVYAGASFHGTANYAFFDMEGRMVTHKMRSYRKFAQRSIQNIDDGLDVVDESFQPAKAFLEGLYHDPGAVERSQVFIHTSILKLGIYNRQHDVKFEKGRIFPGCTLETARLLRECSLSVFTFTTREQQKAWEREYDNLRSLFDQTYEGLYRELASGKLDYKSMVKEINKAVTKGQRGLIALNRRGQRAALESQIGKHPASDDLGKTKSRLAEWYGFVYSEDADLLEMGWEE